MPTLDRVRNAPGLTALTAIFLLTLTLSGCSRDSGEPPAPKAAQPSAESSQAAAPAPADTQTEALIPRTLLFGNPERIRGRLSPSGELVSYVAPVDGIMNVWVGPANDLGAARPVTSDTSRGIQQYQWSASDDDLLYLRDTGGDENNHVHAVSLATGEIRDLTPYAGARAEIYGLSWSRPGEIVVGINDRNPEYFDVYRVALATGERSLLLENNEYGSFVIDDDLAVRVAVRPTEDGGGDMFRVDTGDEGPVFTQIASISAADNLSTTFLGMTPGNDAVHVITARDRDKAALMAMDLDDGSFAVVAENNLADVDAVMLEPTTREVLAYAATFTRQTWVPVQDGFGKHLENITKNTPGDMNLLGQTRDGNRWIFVSDAPGDPVPYYVYDRTTGDTNRLFSSYPELAAMPLRTMTPIVIESRDGLPLVSYLTLPPEADPDGDGKADAKAPLVLNVHGGPWARDTYGYDPTHQWLANRGYAVLSVNYRGSTGFGKAFVEAAVGEWAGKMHDDLLDAVDWAVVEGITDPDTVAIMGGSYGGYATLVGLTFTPDRFACGVDIVGPSNLQTLLGTIPPYWKSFFETFTRHLGDPRTEEGRALLQDRSPLNRVDAIQRPLLIGQGANDPRVKQSESDQIVDVMTEKNLPVTYVLFPDEGHGFARPQNRLAFFGITEGFLHTCLGGRFEPLGDALAGSSTRIPAGADIVPGLVEALEGFEPTVRK